MSNSTQRPTHPGTPFPGNPKRPIVGPDVLAAIEELRYKGIPAVGAVKSLLCEAMNGSTDAPITGDEAYCVLQAVENNLQAHLDNISRLLGEG